jgi:DNA-binding protein H-NS
MTQLNGLKMKSIKMTGVWAFGLCSGCVIGYYYATQKLEETYRQETEETIRLFQKKTKNVYTELKKYKKLIQKYSDNPDELEDEYYDEEGEDNSKELEDEFYDDKNEYYDEEGEDNIAVWSHDLTLEEREQLYNDAYFFKGKK